MTPSTARPGAWRDRGRGAARAAPIVSACGPAAARRGSGERAWRTSPAAASPRTCPACCPKGAPRKSTGGRGRSRRYSSSCRRAVTIATDEMFRAFNMGIGLIVVCTQAERRARARDAGARRRTAAVPGSGRPGDREVRYVWRLKDKRSGNIMPPEEDVRPLFSRLAVLISGRGSNLQAIIDAIAGRPARRQRSRS